MGVKKTMDTFFASIQEQIMSGYGEKLVNTPMGPFRWNDNIQLWENVNNGMVMNNISFQDTIMMDYGTCTGGDNGGAFVCNYSTSNVTENILVNGELGYDYDACIIPGARRTTQNTCSITISLYLEYLDGDPSVVEDFGWIYRLSYPETNDDGRDFIPPLYQPMIPIDTKITLNANSKLGFGLVSTNELTNFVLMGKYNGPSFGTYALFKARILNETDSTTLHETEITFSN